ncbi:MAG TPA: hypothetical protein VHX63_06065 [Acidobacteriaceae bacterium]|jgi:hypothetical protein|nr:hypothetical protein [Acidobacteriaceae bacterium]
MTAQPMPTAPPQPMSQPQKTIRGTQSFVDTMAHCWGRPSLLGLELLWRWGLGIPALLLLFHYGRQIYDSVSLAHTGIYQFSLQDPVLAAEIISSVVDVLLPPVRVVAIWLIPLLTVAWAIASGLGRMAVLRRYDPTLRRAPLLMIGMQLLRILTLGGSFVAWFACLHWIALSSLGGSDPDLVGYFAKAIFLSLGLFSLWAVCSWVFSAAPLIALLENKGMLASLAAALHFGSGSLRGLRSKLVEINLVLGIVKICLIVLAMVFSATLIPFQAQLNLYAMYVWWLVISVLYLAASDFFQVTRLVAFVELWRAVQPQSPDEASALH